MADLTNIVKEMFENEGVNVFIGYKKDETGKCRPAFAFSSDKAASMDYDETCGFNLAVYLNKPEIKKLGKKGIIANYNTLRSIVQLAAENQIKESDLAVITAKDSGEFIRFNTMNEIVTYVLDNYKTAETEVKSKIENIAAMSREDRWDYWVNELADCVKCYACRAACPLCYCDKCTVEHNQPQWIPNAAHTKGNIEWHIMRAMHLAGRCISCNQCAEACPVGLPINLLTARLNGSVEEHFNWRGGMEISNSFALSNFNEKDRENFIR